MPAHHQSGPTGSALALLAGAYVGGSIVAAWRMITVAVLRIGGCSWPSRLPSGVRDTLTDRSVAAGTRIAAIATSTAFGAAVTVAGVWLVGTAVPTTYAHAVARVAAMTSSTLLFLIVAPIPGWPAWPLLVAFVARRGTISQDRTWQAARLGQRCAGVVGGILAVIALQTGDVPYLVAGLAIGLLAWRRGDAVVVRDDLLLFLTSRSAADVAKAVARRVGPDERVGEEHSRHSEATAVSGVEIGGRIIGLIGPRQAVRAGAAGAEQRTCRDVMVPIADIPVLPASMPALLAVPRLVRHGLALVHDRDGSLVLESGDLDRQFRVWRMLAQRRRDHGSRRGGRAA